MAAPHIIAKMATIIFFRKSLLIFLLIIIYLLFMKIPEIQTNIDPYPISDFLVGEVNKKLF